MLRFLILVALTMSAFGIAKPVPELTKFTEEQVATLSAALAAADTSPGHTFGDWNFKRFLLRITAKVGFDIEAIKLELLPELELVWQKQASRVSLMH